MEKNLRTPRDIADMITAIDLLTREQRIVAQVLGREVHLYRRHNGFFLEYGLESNTSDGFVAVIDRDTLEVKNCTAKGNIAAYPSADFILEEMLQQDHFQESVLTAKKNNEARHIAEQQIAASKKVRKAIRS